MKRLIIFSLAISMLAISCSKRFLEEMQSFDKFDESVFTNEVQTRMYIDRLYNYFYAAYRNPLQNEIALGGWDDSRTRMTEEFGGTINNLINPTRNVQNAADADAYYGAALTASTTNNPYTRIRFCNFLLEKMDGVGKDLPTEFRRGARGQAFFMRGWQYFNLVRRYGGVPIELQVRAANNYDESIRTPRSKASEVFAQAVADFDSAAALLPAKWDAASSNYGRFTSAASLAMKSRVLLVAASPLFNADWDNAGSAKWQAALNAGLQAETALTAAGYGLHGSTAKDWSEMTYINDNSFNKEAIIVFLMSNTPTSSVGYNNSWENQVRPKDYNGGGGISAPKQMLDLFPLANGNRPTASNGYIDTFFFENRDPRFYRTFAFSGLKWGRKDNANRTTFFYRWRPNATGNAVYYAGNQTSSPAVVRKMSNPGADTTQLTFSGTDIFEYRYAELLLNIAECYAAKGDNANCLLYLGKIRQRVGIPAANNYGIGPLANKYAAIEACLYERRVELAYEGKRFWDIHRWLLYDGVSSTNPTANTTTKLGLPPINGTARTGYYWQSITFSPANTDPIPAAEKAILIDPDNAGTFAGEIAKLKNLYRNRLVMTPLDQAMDRDGNNPVTILFRPNYYLSGLTSTILSFNPWLPQNIGWLDYNSAPGTYNASE